MLGVWFSVACARVTLLPIPGPDAGWQGRRLGCSPALRRVRGRPRRRSREVDLVAGAARLHARAGLPVVAVHPLWHVMQLRRSWGYVTSPNSANTRVPMTILLSELWILWTSLTRSPSGGSVGLWQTTQNLVSRRPPPWNASGSWHALHAAVVTLSRRTAVDTVPTPALDTTSRSGFATGAVRSGSAVKRAFGRPEIWIAARWSRCRGRRSAPQARPR